MSDPFPPAGLDLLYPERSRTSRLPGAHSELGPDLLDRMGGRYWEDLRQAMNLWFMHLPTSEQPKLRGRLLGKNQRQFTSAFWELTLHETFLRAGYSIEVEPTRSNHARRPDFRITKGGSTFYVEARLADHPIDVGARKRVNRVLDIVDSVKASGWAAKIQIEAVGAHDPRKHEIVRPIQDWIPQLEDEPKKPLRIDIQGWHLRLEPILKSDDPAWIDKRLIGMQHSPLDHWLSEPADIIRALKDKSSAYGELDAPPIIALAAGESPNDFDVMNALYGELQMTVQFTDNGLQTSPTRKRNGHWYRGDEWANPHVAGVLIGRQVDPMTIGTMIPTLWLHPDGSGSGPEVAYWRYAEPVELQIQLRDAATPPREFFGLDPEWATFPTYDYDADH